MAAARKQSSSTGIDFSNSRRSLQSQAQPPRNPVPSKSPRGVVKQQTIPRLNDPAGYDSLALRLLWIKFKYKAEESSYTSAPTKQIDQPPKDYCSSYDRSWAGFTSEQSSPTRTGLNGTGEEKSDQGGHIYVDKLYDEWQQGTYYLNLLQDCSTRFWANLRRRRDLTARKSPFSDHISSPRKEYKIRDGNHDNVADRHKIRSGWWPDGPGHAKITPKAPSAISPAACLLEIDPDAEAEMPFPPETRPSFHEQLFVEVKGIQAGLVMIEAKSLV